MRGEGGKGGGECMQQISAKVNGQQIITECKEERKVQEANIMQQIVMRKLFGTDVCVMCMVCVRVG